MRDEPKKKYHHRPPWRPEMPHISIPIETVTNNVRPGVYQPSSTTVSLPGTTNFVLGADTCGFTTSSTITCDFGNECTNVGSFRGCCSPGNDDYCISTIYTECIDHEDIGYSEDCGAHTLCCPQTNPYCFTYAYVTQAEPGVTFRHVQCNPSNGFGELFPFPPELMTTSTSAAPLETNSSTDDDSSSHSTPTGAIVGAVVGSVAFVILVIIATVLFCRRHRRNHQRAALNTQAAQSSTAKTPQNSADVSPSSEKEQAQAAAANKKRTHRSFLRPLSLIREQPSPIPPATATSPASTTREKHKTVAVGSAARRSFGPNWPLNSNPLGAHPIDADLKKRLSDSRIGARMQHGDISGQSPPPSQQRTRVPILQLPTPPPPGSKPAPLRSPRSSGSPSGPTSMLQSPRLSYVPVSPIEGVAFGASSGGNSSSTADKRGSRAFDQVKGDGTPASAVARANSTRRPRSAVQQIAAEPVSPIESDGDGIGNEGGSGGGGMEDPQHRLSYVSAPSVPGDADRELVSPVTPDGDRDDENGGRGSPGLISPLDGRLRGGAWRFSR